jgi:hypothetical protein
MKIKKRTLKQIFAEESTLKATYNTDLIEYLKKYDGNKSYVFGGVVMKDEVKKMQIKKKMFFIVNYDKSSKGGSHWVGCVKNGDILYHFGSYGIPPLREITGHFSTSHIHYNDRAVQLNDSAICGHLCLAFIEWMILDNANKTFYKFMDECLKYSNRYKKDVRPTRQLGVKYADDRNDEPVDTNRYTSESVMNQMSQQYV